MRLLTIIILISVVICLFIVLHKFVLISINKKVILTILSLGFIFFVFPLLLLLIIGLQSTPAPPPPVITNGSFPFRLEYEVEGERYLIEDTLIAEYDKSVAGNTTTTARRWWNSNIMSGENRFVLKEKNDLRITFHPGYAEYYMGDLCQGTSAKSNSSILLQPNITIRVINLDGRISTKTLLIEEAYEVLSDYGIVIISWSHAELVVNNFIERADSGEK
ncbi:MAG: hypothetical protein LBC96_09560 [Lachnospiraceae bacterium]|jgi:hypothetical protein|nr:hypothetical protein [Lachnospiraceae bacterium]